MLEHHVGCCDHVATWTQANFLIRDLNIYQETSTIYRLICLKCHHFYAGSTIGPIHIRIKEHLNTDVSSFHQNLIKCQKNDNTCFHLNEAIIRYVGNFRIKEAFRLWSGRPAFNPWSKHTKDSKMVLNAALLNTQHYKVLFTNPSARAGYDTRSIFKRSLTGLNSEFSFS